MHGDLRHPSIGSAVEVRTQLGVCQRVPSESARLPADGRVTETSSSGERNYPQYDGPVAPYQLIESGEQVAWSPAVDVVQP